MNKEKILRKSEDFSEIISNQKYFKNKYFSLYYKESNTTLFGITKNIIHNNEKYIHSNYNYVIIIKEPAILLKYTELENNLLDLMKKVGTK